jgi:hypothetical protein
MKTLRVSTYAGWLAAIKANAALLLESFIGVVVLVFCASVLLGWGVGMGLLMLVNGSLDVLGDHVEFFE